jgi:hypothetical protein
MQLMMVSGIYNLSRAARDKYLSPSFFDEILQDRSETPSGTML